MYVWICLYVRMYICTYVCMYAHRFVNIVRIYVTHARTYVYVRISMHMRMYVCMYVPYAQRYIYNYLHAYLCAYGYIKCVLVVNTGRNLLVDMHKPNPRVCNTGGAAVHRCLHDKQYICILHLYNYVFTYVRM